MGILHLLTITGVLTPAEAFTGFSDSSIQLIMAMFIVGDALFITGVADKICKRIVRFAKNERMAIAIVMLALGLLSAFLSNTGAAAIFIPITLSIARSAYYNRNRMLMAISIAANIGGTLTLLGTPPNIIVSSALIENNLPGFSVFDFTPFALPIFTIAILYYTFIGAHMIPDDQHEEVGQIDQSQLKQVDEDNQAPW